MNWGSTIEVAHNYVADDLPEQPRIGLVLGSGLAETVRLLSDPRTTIDYKDIPGFPDTSVAGHPGQYIFGYVHEIPVLAARGRYHYYEGHSIPAIQLPVRLMAKLGIDILIITNAAGCTNESWSIGEFMVHTGHMDFSFLESIKLPPVVSALPWHSDRLIHIASAAAADCHLNLRQGNYAWTLGPSFETPAEIGLIRAAGGDAVGMSTVPEYWAAVKAKVEVLGISCLTNYAAGVQDAPLDHAAVLTAGTRTSANLATLLDRIIGMLADG